MTKLSLHFGKITFIFTKCFSLSISTDKNLLIHLHINTWYSEVREIFHDFLLPDILWYKIVSYHMYNIVLYDMRQYIYIVSYLQYDVITQIDFQMIW